MPRGKRCELHASAGEQPNTELACKAKPWARGFDISDLIWAKGLLPHVGRSFTLLAQTGLGRAAQLEVQGLGRFPLERLGSVS